MSKIQNHTKDYKKLLKRLEHYGIYYSLNFLFGLEEDHPQIFDDTLAFLHEVKAPEAFFNTVTPRKGTPMRTKAFGQEPPGSLLDSMQVAGAAIDTLLSTGTGHIVDLRKHDPIAH